MSTVEKINFVIMCVFFLCYSYQFAYIPIGLLTQRKYSYLESRGKRVAVLIAAMCGCAEQGHDIVTCYRNSKNYGDNWISAGIGLWFLRESRYLNGARAAVGSSCAVSGTGFLFTRKILERCGGLADLCGAVLHAVCRRRNNDALGVEVHTLHRGKKAALCLHLPAVHADLRAHLHCGDVQKPRLAADRPHAHDGKHRSTGHEENAEDKCMKKRAQILCLHSLFLHQYRTLRRRMRCNQISLPEANTLGYRP